LLGQAPAGSDCSCAADCNCTAATEASDPICTVLRLIDGFSPDTCALAAPNAALLIERRGEASDVSVLVGPARANKDARRTHVVVSLGGSSIDQVAGLRISLSAAKHLGRIRLSRRLRRRGFVVSVGRADHKRATAVVMPPVELQNIPTIGTGPLLRVTLPADRPGMQISDVQLGSRQGLPLQARVNGKN